MAENGKSCTPQPYCPSSENTTRCRLSDTRIPDWDFDDEFDGGEESCGRVIINLYMYLKPLTPGTRILVISKDPAAPIELPAWCRMTENTLLATQHPYYLIVYKPKQKEK